MKSTFQLVSQMNTAFGNPKGDPLNINWLKVQKQFLNVPDEIGELFVGLGGHAKGSEAEKFVKDAVAKFKKDLAASLEMDSDNGPDLKTVRDSSRDIVVFTDGGNHLMGIDADRDMQTVIQGVMTRFIKDDADKEATIAKHVANGITEVYFEGEYPTMIMKSAIDQPDAPKGKFLKSASYQEFEFYDLAEENSSDADVQEGSLRGIAKLLQGMVWTPTVSGIRRVESQVNAHNSAGEPTRITFVVDAADYEDPEDDFFGADDEETEDEDTDEKGLDDEETEDGSYPDDLPDDEDRGDAPTDEDKDW